MSRISRLVSLIALCTLVTACGNPNRQLDDYVFYDGPQFRLKVVRYYRNIPFNKLGEYAVVMCQSEHTSGVTSPDRQDAGWRTLGSADGSGSKNAREVALRVKNDYDIVDDHTLVAKTAIINISFDACGHFIHWDPGRLPQLLVAPVARLDACAPDGPADCRHYDFRDDRAPHYEQIKVSGKGQVEFTVSSKAFKGVESLRVSTRNNGAVWHVETVGLKTDGQSLEPEKLRSLSVAALEKDMDDVSLMDWFESILPAHSMVMWPDAMAACKPQQLPDKQEPAERCAEIHFNDSAGNKGAVYITLSGAPETGPGHASLYSVVYRTQDGKSRPIQSLRRLGELAANAK